MQRIILFVSLLLIACSGPSSVPKQIIPKNKMQTLLHDLIRADEVIDFYRVSDSTYQPFARRTAFYDSVFQLHEVTKKDFQRSLSYYQGRPDLLKEMFDDMYRRITDTTKLKPPANLIMRNREKKEAVQ